MDILFLVSRIVFGGYLLMSGSNHFTHGEMLAGYAASKGVPMAKLAVWVSGLLLILGGLGILLGIYVEYAVLAIALFFIPVTFKIHNFWTQQDPQAKMMDMIHFMKNMAILAASLAYLFVPQPWTWTLL